MSLIRHALMRLDHRVLDRSYGTPWLVLGAVCGVGLAALGAWGLARSSDGGVTALPLGIGVVLAGLSLFELWRRRQRASGKEALARLQEMDDRLLPNYKRPRL